MERVKIYNDKGMPERKGVGIYAGDVDAAPAFAAGREEGGWAMRCCARISSNACLSITAGSGWCAKG